MQFKRPKRKKRDHNEIAEELCMKWRAQGDWVQIVYKGSFPEPFISDLKAAMREAAEIASDDPVEKLQDVVDALNEQLPAYAPTLVHQITHDSDLKHAIIQLAGMARTHGRKECYDNMSQKMNEIRDSMTALAAQKFDPTLAQWVASIIEKTGVREALPQPLYRAAETDKERKRREREERARP